MKKLWCKIFGHNVETLKVNPYQVPTKEGCTCCGLTRSMEYIEGTDCLHWVYSDGRRSVGYKIFRIDDVKFGGVS